MNLRAAVALMLALLGPLPLAYGDGGTLRLSQRRGGFIISIFTSPSPLRVGAVDVSVLVQEESSRKARPDLAVEVSASRADSITYQAAATQHAATNKLFRAAQFDLPKSGPWHLQVIVHDRAGPIAVDCDIELAEANPPWIDLSLWIGWPAVAIGLFGVHRCLVRRRRTAGVAH